MSGDPNSNLLSVERQIYLGGLTNREFLYHTQRMGAGEKKILFSYESQRERSFIALWPLEGYINAADLAKDGLFYRGQSDHVQCVFCQGVLKNWELGDNVHNKHRSIYPYCPFVSGRLCGNIPIEPTTSSSTSSSTGFAAGILPAHAPYSLPHSQPVIRQNSYSDFPETVPVGINELVAAGFYYTGEADKVRCFQCGGTLRDWGVEDRAWDEHARYFPYCAYLINSKGVDYIKEHAEGLNEGGGNTSYRRAAGAEQLFEAYTSAITALNELTLEDRDDVKYCLAMGHDMDTIKKALKLNEGLFDSIPQMIEHIYIIEDQEGFIDDRGNESSAAEEINDEEPSGPSIEEIVRRMEKLTEEESVRLLQLSICRHCQMNLKEAIALPCGCFSLCEECGKRQNFPKKCPRCSRLIKGTIRIYLS